MMAFFIFCSGEKKGKTLFLPCTMYRKHVWNLLTLWSRITAFMITERSTQYYKMIHAIFVYVPMISACLLGKYWINVYDTLPRGRLHPHSHDNASLISLSDVPKMSFWIYTLLENNCRIFGEGDISIGMRTIFRESGYSKSPVHSF